MMNVSIIDMFSVFVSKRLSLKIALAVCSI